MKKGRSISPTEKPLYAHVTRLFLSGQLHAFWAFERNEWAVQFAADAPVLPQTLDEIRNTLRRLDPAGCQWDNGKPAAKPGKPEFEKFLHHLLSTSALSGSDVREAMRLLGQEPTPIERVRAVA